MEHINIELIRNEDVAFIGMGDQEVYVTPESFAIFAREAAALAEQSGTAHLTLQLSTETIPLEEVEE